jgi:hypothetical protein
MIVVLITVVSFPEMSLVGTHWNNWLASAGVYVIGHCNTPTSNTIW